MSYLVKVYVSCLEWNGVNGKLLQLEFHRRRDIFTGAKGASLRAHSRNRGRCHTYTVKFLSCAPRHPVCQPRWVQDQTARDWEKNHYPTFLGWSHHRLICRNQMLLYMHQMLLCMHHMLIYMNHIILCMHNWIVYYYIFEG
jgi:hypothetical protein